MKKIIVFALVCALVLLSGCGDNALFKDKTYIIKEVDEQVTVSVRVGAKAPKVHESVKEHINTQTMPCLTILKYENDTLTVSSHNYDGDAKKKFKTATFAAAKDIVFETLTVVEDKGEVTSDFSAVPKEAYQFIGEFYTYGYCDINASGEITHVIFYGETIIE